MRIALLLGSQRGNGSSKAIEESVERLNLAHDVDLIRMAEMKVEGCVACERCAANGRCALPPGPNDRFGDILRRLVACDALLVVTPIYSPFPSRLTALLERLLSVSFFAFYANGVQRPLKGKPTAIICYGSSRIEDETGLKILFQKLLADEYSFTAVTYPYLNTETDPNGRFPNVIEYVKDVLLNRLPA
jgi:multimeric flavodoxin WrbA